MKKYIQHPYCDVDGRMHLVRQDLPARLLTGEVCGGSSDGFWH